jgi:peptidyl-prolyl cis-trans isomerase SurA
MSTLRISTAFPSVALGLLLCMSLLPTQHHAQTVVTVGGESVSADDFAHIFKKNNRDSLVTPSALDEYMELFIDFKLKVMAAEDLGMDTASAFINELAGYRKQLARPYLVDNDLLDAMVKQAYDRTLEEVRASHLLVKIGGEGNPSDTLSAWNKSLALKERISSGEDFAGIARSRGGSDDPSVKDNGGDLGWFSAFMMLYSFEEACYTGEVGELVGPIRTRYGYHIIKLTGRRPARGEMRVAHIMIRPDTNNGEANEAKAKIDALAAELASGASFAELARQHSDDQSSRTKGGELPMFGTGRMVESFEEAAFGLATDGDISDPVETQYGWHIIQRLEYKAPPTFDESKRDLEKKLQRDSRSEQVRNSFIQKRKTEYGYTLDEKRFGQVVDATVIDSTLQPIVVKKGLAKKPILTVGNEKTTVRAFIDFVGTNSGRVDVTNQTAESLLRQAMSRFSDESVIAYEDARLEMKHNDFRLLMEEYHDGILLFELTDQKVWSKAVRDSAGLQAFWEENQSNYAWKTRIAGRIFRCADREAADRILAEATEKEGDVETERREMVSENPLSITIEESRVEEGANPVLDAAFSTLGKPGFTDFEEVDGQIRFVQINSLENPSGKTLDEARGKVIADFQDFLEKTWVAELRARYPHEVNRAALHAID